MSKNAASSVVEGFVPTGWYPTLVRLTPDGKRLLIASGKGSRHRPTRYASERPIDPIAPPQLPDTIGNNLNGLLSFVAMPDAKKLSALPKQVDDNAPIRTPSSSRLPPRPAPLSPRRLANARLLNTSCTS